jgi:hypothetical protein
MFTPFNVNLLEFEPIPTIGLTPPLPNSRVRLERGNSIGPVLHGGLCRELVSNFTECLFWHLGAIDTNLGEGILWDAYHEPSGAFFMTPDMYYPKPMPAKANRQVLIKSHLFLFDPKMKIVEFGLILSYLSYRVLADRKDAMAPAAYQQLNLLRELVKELPEGRRILIAYEEFEKTYANIKAMTKKVVHVDFVKRLCITH